MSQQNARRRGYRRRIAAARRELADSVAALRDDLDGIHTGAGVASYHALDQTHRLLVLACDRFRAHLTSDRWAIDDAIGGDQ